MGEYRSPMASASESSSAGVHDSYLGSGLWWQFHFAAWVRLEDFCFYGGVECGSKRASYASDGVGCKSLGLECFDESSDIEGRDRPQGEVAEDRDEVDSDCAAVALSLACALSGSGAVSGLESS